jgi:hypothetical protein
MATNNMTFGIKRLPHNLTGTKYELAERLGRLSGDIATMVQGLAEDGTAGGAEVVTFGVATVPAGALAAHGTTIALGSGYAAAGEISGLVNYMSKKGHGSSNKGTQFRGGSKKSRDGYLNSKPK